MTPQQRLILEVGSQVESFIPAFLVKMIRKYPNDYRKRLSELKRKKFVKVIGSDGRFRMWSVTNLGKKAIK